MGVVRPAARCPRRLLPQRRGRRDAVRPRGRRAARHELRAAPLRARATTSSCRSGRPGGSSPDAGSDQRMLYLECPSEIEAPKRYRNDYGQLLEHSPYSQRDIRLPDEVPPRTDEGEFTVHVKMRNRLTAYHYTPPPVRRRRLGRLPVAVRVQHRRLRADHRARPPAAAGPPDVRGAELRRVLVRAAQVRLPPAGDPGAVQPLEHQLATRSSTTSPATS